MEFPQLGEHCFEKTCNMLDFLPMKCDACGEIFCKDHFHYARHSCANAYKKDVQVPVCPLCNKPIPSKRGEQPDIAVGGHIDRDCQSDPAVSNRKIYTNRCALKGCKQKELIPVVCNSCRKNYCLKHRHPTDHKCEENKESGKPLSSTGAAAFARSQNFRNFNSSPRSSHKNYVPVSEMPPSSIGERRAQVTSYQQGISEDEALALALQQSMMDCANQQPTNTSRDVQEEEDRMLAQALAASERDQNLRREIHQKDKSCSIS